MSTPNINPRANGEGQLGQSDLRWGYIYASAIDGQQVYDGGLRVATLESPVFTGTPTSPTQTATNNSERIATTEFVHSLLSYENYSNDITSNSNQLSSHSGRLSSVEALAGNNSVTMQVNAAEIATNTSDIATNTSDIATNTSGIATNTSGIATNTANIATNTSDIATNTSGIATNTSGIATNTSNIATNTSNIATNTSNIATNTSNIATNTSDISQNKKGYSNIEDVADSATFTPTTTGHLAVLGSGCTINIDSIADNGLIEITNPELDGELTWSSPRSVVDNEGTTLSQPHALTGCARLIKTDTNSFTLIEYKTTHTHPQSEITNLVADMALKADLASPALTGNPTAPTQTPLDNSTKIATTSYVAAAVVAANGQDYAEIYTSGGVTTQTVQTTFADISGFSSSGLDELSSADHANNKITVGATGVYMAMFSVSFTGTNGSTFTCQLKNTTQGTVYANCKLNRKVSNHSAIGSASFSGIISADAADDITVQVKSDASSDSFTPSEMSFSIHKL